MALATNIIRRPGSANYYLRVMVPTELQHVVKRREVWKSLKTSDQREAKQAARRELDRLEAEWHRLRTAGDLTADEIQDAIWRRYLELVEADERFRENLPTDEDLDDIWQELRREFDGDSVAGLQIFRVIRDKAEEDRAKRAKRLATLKEALRTNQTKPVADVTRSTLDDMGRDLDRSDPRFKRLAGGLARAEVEALHRSAERDDGDFTGAPRDPMVRPPTKPKATEPVAAPGETILELFDRYVTENPGNVKNDTLSQARMAVELFVDFVGPRFPVASIDRKTVGAWKALLLRYPVKAAETRIFRGLGLKQIVAENETAKKPTITKRTVNRYLSGLGAFAQWLRTNEFIQVDPMDGHYLKVEKKSGRRPFTVDELNALFKAPLFTGCLSDDKIGDPGNVRIGDHRYWVPLLMLFSGARPGELGQLLVDDVRQQHGQWIMHVVETDDDDKSVKTGSSRRVIPVHTKLIELGFITYREKMAERGEKRLFPKAERNGRGQILADFSRDFTRVVLRRVGIEDPGRISLYSFRHGFVDALRRAELLDDEFGFLVGHGKPSTTGLYGMMPQGMLRQRVEMVERVAYPGLDLGHLVKK